MSEIKSANASPGDRAAELFDEALSRSGAAREAFLDAQCHDDPALRAQLAMMIRAHEEVGSFLAQRKTDVPAGAGMPALEDHLGGNVGRYRLIRVVGEGGFGVVYLAEQEAPVRRKVALKVIKLGMDTREVVARFEAERQTLALMDHPGVAKVLDAGSTPAGRPYFVMELVDGTPITEYCDAHQLATRERLRLFISVCLAVQHAHQKGVIHRDIKPSNVLVTMQDGLPAAKIIDFGIAKATDTGPSAAALTQQCQLVGTPAYMSPEQAGGAGADIDTRSDIYGLGVLLYELLTGATPFDAKQLQSASFDEVLRIIREVEPIRPSTRFSSLGGAVQVAERRQSDTRRLHSAIRGDLDWIVMKCLEKDRTRRYPTAAALADDLQRHLDDLPILAGPPATIYRMRKFARRHRGAVAMVAVSALSLLLATAISITFAWREAQQRRLAESRGHETKQVAEFQAAMLRGLDAEAFGQSFRTHFRETLEAALERERVGSGTNVRLRTADEVEAELVAFDHVVGSMQMPDVARRVLDDVLLAQAAKTLDESFANQPLVQAAIRDSIAASYRALGLFDAAESQYRAAIALREKELGRESREVAAGLNDVATILNEKGQFAEGEAICREALAIQQRLLGDRHPDVAATLSNLGVLRQQVGDLAEAESRYVEALSIRREKLGPDHPDVASTLNSLAAVMRAKGDRERAEAMFREALAIWGRGGAEGDPEQLLTMQNLAVLLGDKGDLDGAIAVNLDALTLARRRFGNEHQQVANILTNVALHHKRRGDLDRAESLYRESLGIRRATLGNRHPDVAHTLNNLAVLLRDRGDFAAAEPLYREALAIQASVFPPGHEVIAASRAGLGRTLLKSAGDPALAAESRESRLAEAEALLLSSDEALSRSPNAPALFVRRCLETLAELYELRHMDEPTQGYDAKAAAYRARLEALGSKP